MRNRERWLKNVFITGGTGTFGNALCEYLIKNEEANNIIILSRDENKQFSMKKRLKEKYPEFDRLHFCIGDIRDRDALCYWMKDIDVVFHAGALKHVPVGEAFPDEIIKTNIIGTQNVLYAANYNRVRRMVNLSSDKAVQPINAYGMAKGLSEKLMTANKGYCSGVSLRYGNVISSRGSVVPIFIEQLQNDKPLTVTNKDMTRFLLPKEQAIDLAMYCASSDDLVRGSVVVITSPACTVKSLVEALYHHFNSNHPMIYSALKKMGFVVEVGVRPGEKMHETLITYEEMTRSIFRKIGEIHIGIIYPSSEIYAEKLKDSGEIKKVTEFTSENTHRLNSEETYDYMIRNGIL